MKRLLTLMILTGAGFCSHAQMNIYSALTIPDSLKKDADMVMREEHIKLIIKDKNTARYEVHSVFTVFNESAKEYLNFVNRSDKFHVLEDAEIKLYDLTGKKINSWSKKEMNSGKYGNELVPEGKYTLMNVNAPVYPVTMELQYSVKYKGILGLPPYIIQSPGKSVQHSVLEVEVPTELGIRYKLVNTDKKPQLNTSGNKEIYRWEISGQTPLKWEKHSGSYDNFLPLVYLAPTKFQLDEYDGDMSSWKSFGFWLNDLFTNVSALTEEKKQFYRDMVKKAADDREKAAILYNYLQNNMRYVSIQLGIGGWRPFPASFVDEKKYGDCKALSNYMKSTLDAVGIRSNIIIIYRDYEPKFVDEKFPMNDFNHAILCIPQAKDSIWLECTSTSLPFAKLDESTLNRKAVMVTESGGVLVKTPSSNYQNNTEGIHTIIEVNEDGGAKVKTMLTLNGESREIVLERYHDLKEDEKRKFFITNMEWKQPDNFEVANSKDKAIPYQVSATMEYEKIYSFNAGNKLFFEPRLYPFFDEDIPEYEKRRHDFHFDYPYQVMDTTVYKFPAGFNAENIPKNKLVDFSFAHYTCNYNWEVATKTLTAIALLQIKERVIKAADYTKLVDFKKQVLADMNEKVVMKKE